jgi:hypothetical protein
MLYHGFKAGASIYRHALVQVPSRSAPQALECGDASPQWPMAPSGKSKQGGAGAPHSKTRRCFTAIDGGTPKQSGE